MLRRNECRLNCKNRPVRTGDIKGGPKQPPLATNRGSQEPATNRVNEVTKVIRLDHTMFFALAEGKEMWEDEWRPMFLVGLDGT